MKTIHPAPRLRQFLRRRFLISIPHVRASDLNRGTPVWPAFLQPIQQGFLASIFHNVQNQPQLRGRDDQNKFAMPFVQSNLVKADRSYLGVAAALDRFFAQCSKTAWVASSLRPS